MNFSPTPLVLYRQPPSTKLLLPELSTLVSDEKEWELSSGLGIHQTLRDMVRNRYSYNEGHPYLLATSPGAPLRRGVTLRTSEMSGFRKHIFRKKLAFTEEAARHLALWKRLDAHSGCVNRLCWNFTGSLLASVGDDTRLCLWSLSDIDSQPNPKPHIMKETGHRENIFGVCFIGSNQVATGGMDTDVKLMDISNGKPFTYVCHHDRVKQLISLPGPPVWWSCAEDGTVRQFDARESHMCHREDMGCKNVLVAYPSVTGCRTNWGGPTITGLTRSGFANFHHDVLSQLTSIAIHPIRTEYLAIAAKDSIIRLFDRRVLSLTHTLDSKATPCDSFCPISLWDDRYPVLPISVSLPRLIYPTYIVWRPDGQELIGTYSSDHVYVFPFPSWSTQELATSSLKLPQPFVPSQLNKIPFYEPSQTSKEQTETLSNEDLWQNFMEEIYPSEIPGVLLTVTGLKSDDIIPSLVSNEKKIAKSSLITTDYDDDDTGNNSKAKCVLYKHESHNSDSENCGTYHSIPASVMLHMNTCESSAVPSLSSSSFVLPYPLYLAVCESELLGNQLMAEHKYGDAIEAYTAALNLAGPAWPARVNSYGVDPEPTLDQKIAMFRIPLLCNRSLALMMRGGLHDAYQAEVDAREALSYDITSPKALYRLIQSKISRRRPARDIESGLLAVAVGMLMFPEAKEFEKAAESLMELGIHITRGSELTLSGPTASPTNLVRLGQTIREHFTTEVLDRRRGLNLSKEGLGTGLPRGIADRFYGRINAATDIQEANFWGTQAILAGCNSGIVCIWRRGNGSYLNALNPVDSLEINCVQPHPFLPILAISGLDTDVSIWKPMDTMEPSNQENGSAFVY